MSFSINLLLIPIAVARFWMPSPPLTPGLPRTEMVIEHMVRDLPKEDAGRFRLTMEDHLGDIEAARVHMLAARRAMSRAIATSPYDPVAMQNSIKTWQTAWNGWSEALGRAMMAALPSLSEPGRQELAAMGRRGPGAGRRLP